MWYNSSWMQGECWSSIAPLQNVFNRGMATCQSNYKAGSSCWDCKGVTSVGKITQWKSGCKDRADRELGEHCRGWAVLNGHKAETFLLHQPLQTMSAWSRAWANLARERCPLLCLGRSCRWTGLAMELCVCTVWGSPQYSQPGTTVLFPCLISKYLSWREVFLPVCLAMYVSKGKLN